MHTFLPQTKMLITFFWKGNRYGACAFANPENIADDGTCAVRAGIASIAVGITCTCKI